MPTGPAPALGRPHWALALLLVALPSLGLPAPSAAYTVLEGDPNAWSTVSPGAPTSAPATGHPVGHYLRLGPEADAALVQLQQAVQSGRVLLDMGRLSSARATLAPAREAAQGMEQRLPAVKLSPAWVDARARLEELWVAYRSAQSRNLPDPEGEALAVAEAKPLQAKASRLEAEAARLSPSELMARVAALRQEVEAVSGLARLKDLPAWDREALALGGRLVRLEQAARTRQSHRLLADGLARLALLEHSAKRRLQATQLEAADGDLRAMEEAAVDLLAQLEEARKVGVDLGALRLSSGAGDRQGQAVLGQVQAWLAFARRRAELLQEAADPWRRVLTGDRLRLYGMRGKPTWPGAPPDPTPAEALAQPMWVYWESQAGPPNAPPQRLRHRFRFDADRLIGHEQDSGQSPLGPVF